MKKHLISAISIVSAVSALLFLAGLWMVFEDQQANTGVKTENTGTGKNTKKAGNTNEITITAIGDSLTRGTGDTAGKGYAGYTADEVKKKNKEGCSVAKQWDQRAYIKRAAGTDQTAANQT